MPYKKSHYGPSPEYLKYLSQQRKLNRKKKKAEERDACFKEYLKNLNYKEYILSARWKKKRKKKLESINYKCEKCGARAWQVHHKHYRTLGCESNKDLMGLCGTCHGETHNIYIKSETDELNEQHLSDINWGRPYNNDVR